MITVYGGTFNPPHNGHVATVSALKAQSFTLVVPSVGHEFKPQSRATYAVRKLMARAAFGADLHAIEDLIELSDERRALLVMRKVRKVFGESKIVFAIGPDIDPSSWTGYSEIMAEGFGFVRVPENGDGIRSTQIRAMLAAGNFERARRYVPSPVMDLIEREISRDYWTL